MAPLPLVRLGNRLVQKIDPVYLDPQDRRTLSFRSHFLSPNKNFFGSLVPTFYFNVGVIWMFTVFAYIALYYNALGKLLVSFENLGSRISKMPLKFRFRRKKTTQSTSVNESNN